MDIKRRHRSVQIAELVNFGALATLYNTSLNRLLPCFHASQVTFISTLNIIYFFVRYSCLHSPLNVFSLLSSQT